jgi:signal transduction histidine kinase/CheY-like chemotaxis protein
VCNKNSDYDDSDLQQLETFINGAWLLLRRRKYLQELAASKEEAEKANKAKGEFLASTSHELRTPLNGVLSMLQLLSLQQAPEQLMKYVRLANVAGESLLRIISDLLDFSRMESGKLLLHPKPANLKDAVRADVRLLRREARKKGLRLKTSISRDIPSCLMVDEARVQQIINNLVGNSLKFTEKGEINVSLELMKEWKPGWARVALTVRDTGIGIAPDQTERIFEAFTQLENPESRKHPGTGLGLGIVKRLTKIMNGDISVESVVGQGTTMRCSLAFPVPSAAGGQTKAPAVPHYAQEPLDILVAEDDEVSRFAIEAFLKRTGNKVFCVENGEQALAALRLHPFHCLFTDIQMPVLGGLAVAERIRGGLLEDIIPSEALRKQLARSSGESCADCLPVDPNIIIVAVSAYAMSGDRERFIKDGMDFYISKPIIMNDLVGVLQSISDLRHDRRLASNAIA